MKDIAFWLSSDAKNYWTTLTVIPKNSKISLCLFPFPLGEGGFRWGEGDWFFLRAIIAIAGLGDRTISPLLKRR
jgi:hypothetical protein